MGVDYTAFTVIGVKIPIKKLTKVGYVDKPAMFPKECCDEFMETDYKCCPRCGNTLWRSVKEFESTIEGWSEEDWDKGKFFGFPLITDAGWYGKEECNLFIGFKGGGHGEVFSRKDVPNIENIKNALWKTLFPLDLWNEEDFGVWTVLDVG